MLFNNKFQNAFTLRYFLFNSKTQQLPSFYVSTPETIYLKKNYIGWNESMRYRITPSLMVKASYSNEVRIPTTEELLGNGYSILPSPDLAPERVQGVNIGALYRKKQRNEGYVEAEVNLFYNKLKEMVRYMPTMIPTMAKYVNFGETTTYGIEGELKLDAFSWLYVYGNASYQDLRDSRKVVKGSQMANPTYKKRIPNVPYLLANAGFEMHKENLFGGKENNTRLLVDASYIHQYFYDFEMSIYQDRKIPTSFTFDAGLEHSIMNRKLTFTLKVKNVFNRETVTELNRPLPGRSIAFKVRYLLR
jgi:putative mxcH